MRLAAIARRWRLVAAVALALGLAPVSLNAKTFTCNTGSSCTLPADWNPYAFRITIIGAGGNGTDGCMSMANVSNSANGGYGGGGGQIARIFNTDVGAGTFNPGDVLTIQTGVHTGGNASGNDFYVEDNTGTIKIRAESGGIAGPCVTTGGTPPGQAVAGGSGSRGIGTILHSGGPGGYNPGPSIVGSSGGGGGAGSLLGDGLVGGLNDQGGAGSLMGAGGAVGGGNNTAAYSITTWSSGREASRGPYGYQGALSPTSTSPGNDGIYGGGGAAGEVPSGASCCVAGSAGGNGSTFADPWGGGAVRTSDSQIFGPSAGGGGGGGHASTVDVAANGGNGYTDGSGCGGGGGGGGAGSTTVGHHGNGAPGCIIFEYDPTATNWNWVLESVTLGNSSVTVPANFGTLVSAECIGPGGKGSAPVPATGVGAGGGGGADAQDTAGTLTASGTATATVPTGGSSTMTELKGTNGATIVKCDFGTNASGATKGTGGLAANSTGATKYNGGDGGQCAACSTNTGRAGSGGGGAAGHNGAGKNGGNSVDSPANALQGGGGGGADSGSATAGVNAASNTSTNGGDGNAGTGHGLGATSTANPVPATVGGGGAGWRAVNAFGVGGWGSIGNEFDAEHGAGGGGGGGSGPGAGACTTSCFAGWGGMYGGGGAGSGNGNAGISGTLGQAGQGYINVTYTPSSGAAVNKGQTIMLRGVSELIQRAVPDAIALSEIANDNRRYAQAQSH